MANIQGAVAPFASLLPMLPGSPSGPLADTVTQITQRLAGPAAVPPPLDVMIDDFARYHAVMAVIAAVVAIVFISVSVLSWKAFAATARTGTRARRLFASLGVVSALIVTASILLVVANATVAADPEPALLAFFQGGW
jgi:hypothetical protein